MFLVYNLNIMIYRYDSFLFNYHATIINQLFNHHFSRYQGRLHLHLSGLEIRVCRCLTPGSRQKNVTILLKICYMLHVKKLLYS